MLAAFSGDQHVNRAAHLREAALMRWKGLTRGFLASSFEGCLKKTLGAKKDPVQNRWFLSSAYFLERSHRKVSEMIHNP